MLAHGSHEIDSGEAGDPGNREAILAAMELDVQRLLASQSPMEELTENRFLSLERYIAFLVSPLPPDPPDQGGSLGGQHEASGARARGGCGHSFPCRTASGAPTEPGWLEFGAGASI